MKFVYQNIFFHLKPSKINNADWEFIKFKFWGKSVLFVKILYPKDEAHLNNNNLPILSDKKLFDWFGEGNTTFKFHDPSSETYMSVLSGIK